MSKISPHFVDPTPEAGEFVSDL